MVWDALEGFRCCESLAAGVCTGALSNRSPNAPPLVLILHQRMHQGTSYQESIPSSRNTKQFPGDHSGKKIGPKPESLFWAPCRGNRAAGVGLRPLR